MGYSNYWRKSRSFREMEWFKICEYYEKILQKKYYHQDKSVLKHIPSVSDEKIWFCGSPKDGSCEDFVLEKDIDRDRLIKIKGDKTEDPKFEFSFCKTQRLPYDKMVWELLCFIRHVVIKDPKIFRCSNDDGKGDILCDDMDPPNYEGDIKWVD